MELCERCKRYSEEYEQCKACNEYLCHECIEDDSTLMVNEQCIDCRGDF